MPGAEYPSSEHQNTYPAEPRSHQWIIPDQHPQQQPPPMYEAYHGGWPNHQPSSSDLLYYYPQQQPPPRHETYYGGWPVREANYPAEPRSHQWIIPDQHPQQQPPPMYEAYHGGWPNHQPSSSDLLYYYPQQQPPPRHETYHDRWPNHQLSSPEQHPQEQVFPPSSLSPELHNIWIDQEMLLRTINRSLEMKDMYPHMTDRERKIEWDMQKKEEEIRRKMLNNSYSLPSADDINFLTVREIQRNWNESYKRVNLQERQ